MSVTRNETVAAGTPVVELRDVSRRFVKRRDRTRSFQERFIRLLSRRAVQQEEFWPLRNVSLTIERGESVGIIGPNGSGKSTLLKLVGGILPPTSGELTVNGRVCSLLELGAGFHPDLTGRENIYLNGSVYGLNRAQMNQRIDPIIDYAELGDFIDTPVKHYSSGMYVRLGFAIAIHTEPDLLLVDEVLAVGDAAFQHKCLASIRRFRDNDGTLLFVSHDLDSIQSVCQRAIWVEDGDIRASGRPADVVMAYIGHVVAHEEERAQQHRDEEPSPWVARRRWGTGKIRITGVQLLNRDGEVATVFRNGDPMTIRIQYHAAEQVESPIFGLAIYHQGGAHLCGPNTKFGGLEIPYVAGDGSVDYRLDALPFLEGDFAVSVAVTNYEDSEAFDYHDRLYTFRVYPGASAERYGILTLAGTWRNNLSRDSQPIGVELSPEAAR